MMKNEKVYLNQNAVLTANGYTHPTNHELGGYTLKNSDTGEYLGLLKLGMNDSNAFPVHCNVNVVPFTRESKVLPSVIKTEGTVGLTVQFLMNKKSDILLRYRQPLPQYGRGCFLLCSDYSNNNKITIYDTEEIFNIRGMLRVC